MKSEKKSFHRPTLVPREYPIGPLRVRLVAFAEFSDWLDGELRKLVARWGHLAPPRRYYPRRRP